MTETLVKPKEENSDQYPDTGIPDQVTDGDSSWRLPYDDDDDAWLLEDDEPKTAEALAEELRLLALRRRYIGDQEMHTYVLGEELPVVTDDEVSAWYNALPTEERESLEEYKAYFQTERERTESAAKEILENLEASAPSLLEGRLPKELEDLFGDGEYALGIRQVAEMTSGDAQADVRAKGGVSSSGQGLTQSFNVVSREDPDYASATVVIGYYGPGKGGKHVVILPVDRGEGSARARAISRHADLTEIARKYGDSGPIAPRYCAGFIDNTGMFFPNKTFMQPGAEAIDFGVEPDESYHEWM